jgi:hypothetical protein
MEPRPQTGLGEILALNTDLFRNVLRDVSEPQAPPAMTYEQREEPSA